jgi:16S rRNA (guanine527-N7)-methyltransferase
MGAVEEAIEVLSPIIPVSRETAERLATLVDLVRKWQPAENLVSPATLPVIWRRHIADSAQLLPMFPGARNWLDLGSGAGFPGLVVAILVGDRLDGGWVDLIESNSRKCAFLRQAIRQTGAPANVHEGRIETILRGWRKPVEVVTARALAPLTDLFAMVLPIVSAGSRAAFLKGRDFAREISEAAQSWDFDLVNHRSLVDSEGVILEITRLSRKAAGTGGASKQ